MQLLGYPINAHYVTTPEPRPLTTHSLANWISLDLAERASQLRQRGNGTIYCLPNGERIIVTALGGGMVSIKNELPLGASTFVRWGILRRDRLKVAKRLERILDNLHQEVPITPKRHQSR
jgi:hypothetical protein